VRAIRIRSARARVIWLTLRGILRSRHLALHRVVAWQEAALHAALKLIDRVTPVRVGEEAERGLDEAMHGENTYASEIA
jgi:ammonia channel protein AmtB